MHLFILFLVLVILIFIIIIILSGFAKLFNEKVDVSLQILFISSGHVLLLFLEVKAS